MLSRTADNLFWLSRYVERADYIARIIDVTGRLSSLPRIYGSTGQEWESALLSVGAKNEYLKNYKNISQKDVIYFLAFDLTNPSSIKNCIESARRNARAVRTALTAEMWEGINSSWLELKFFDQLINNNDNIDKALLGRFVDFVKQMALHIDGYSNRTMLRNDAYWFSRLGMLIERADNTARIIDVKYHVLLPESEYIGGSLDYFQWASILRAVSALTAYHWIYRDSVKPWLVADLLIKRSEMPRSLVSCYEYITLHLDTLAKFYAIEGNSQLQAKKILMDIQTSRTEDLFQNGLHQFIANFLSNTYNLGEEITKQYLI